jgi:hypothetical protein
MKKNQEYRFNMYNAAHRVLLDHSALYASMPALGDAVAELGTNLEAMAQCVEKQVIDITGFARDKAAAEERMLALTQVVAKGALAYATVKDDAVLAAKVRVGLSRLRRHADGVVARHCQAVLDAATTVAGSLADYGVDGPRLDELKAAIQRHDQANSAPRLAITARKGATTELALLLKDTTKLVTRRLDALMERFKLEAPAFHRAYTDARIIVDRGARSADPLALKALPTSKAA